MMELLVCETMVTPEAGVVYETDTELVQEIYITIICYSQLASCLRNRIGSPYCYPSIIVVGTDRAVRDGNCECCECAHSSRSLIDIGTALGNSRYSILSVIELELNGSEGIEGPRIVDVADLDDDWC